MSKAGWQILIRVLILLVLFIIAYYSFQYVFPLVYPFVLGWLFAYLIRPLVRLLRKRGRMPHWLAVTISLLTFFSIGLVILFFATAQLIVQIGNLSALLQRYVQIGQEWFALLLTNPKTTHLFNQVYTFYQNLDNQTQNTIVDNLKNTADNLANTGRQLITNIFRGIVLFLSSLPSLASILVVSLLASFFISLDWDKLHTKFSGMLPKRIQTMGGSVLVDLKRALLGFAKAQLFLISMTALLVIVGLWMFGVHYAVTIGLVTGLVDLLPYLGTGAVFVPWIGYLFFIGHIKLAVELSVLYAIILVTRQILEPKIVSTTVGLDPLVALIALFVGLKLFGFVGIILGPVTVVVITAFYRARVLEELWNYIRYGSTRQSKQER